MRRLLLVLGLVAGCHEQRPELVVVTRPHATSASASASASATSSAAAAVSSSATPASDAGRRELAKETIGPFSSVSAICAELQRNCPAGVKCGCRAGKRSLTATAPYSTVTTVGVDAELVGFTVMHPVVRTSAGFWMAIDGLEAVSIATNETATEIVVALDDADVSDVVPGGERELVLHLSTAGAQEVFESPAKATGKLTPTSHTSYTVICGFAASGTLACTAPFDDVADGVELP